MPQFSEKLPSKPLFSLICFLFLGIALAYYGLSQSESNVRAADSPSNNLKIAQKKKKPKKDIRDQTPVELFMRDKLEDNSEILEGLMTENFEEMIEAAEHLKLMSTATEWHVIQGPIYKQHSAEFRRAADQLIVDAKKKNLDAATLDYVHLTMTCVSCHKFVRGTRVAGHNLPPITIPEIRVADHNASLKTE